MHLYSFYSRFSALSLLTSTGDGLSVLSVSISKRGCDCPCNVHTSLNYMCFSLKLEAKLCVLLHHIHVGQLPSCMLYYCNTVGWAWWDWGLIWWLTILLQCFDTVGWVTWPVKYRPRMTYAVSSGTLNPTQIKINEHVPNYSWAAINLWKNFEIILGKFPHAEIQLFQRDIDEGWNNFISHITTA